MGVVLRGTFLVPHHYAVSPKFLIPNDEPADNALTYYSSLASLFAHAALSGNRDAFKTVLDIITDPFAEHEVRHITHTHRCYVLGHNGCHWENVSYVFHPTTTKVRDKIVGNVANLCT